MVREAKQIYLACSPHGPEQLLELRDKGHCLAHFLCMCFLLVVLLYSAGAWKGTDSDPQGEMEQWLAMSGAALRLLAVKLL